jgi:uncharacterized membrane protein YfhO
MALVEAPPGCALAESPGKDNVTLLRDDLNRVTFQIHTASDGFLVMSDTFYPGWRAQVDRAPTPVVRANFALRGICLPAGNHEVVFSFEPTTLQVGMVLSLVGLVVLALGTFLAPKGPANALSAPIGMSQDVSRTS